MEWTDEKLAALTSPELKNLAANIAVGLAARRITPADAELLIERITTQISTNRKIKARGSRPARPMTLEKRVAVAMGKAAEEMAKRYDLTPATAKKNSAGVKNFKSHNLTAKNGEAKTGGAMKEGKLAIDRYISYRIGESLISLSYILFKDEPEDSARFYVIGTDDVMSEGQRFADLLAQKTGYGWSAAFQARMNVMDFEKLDKAAAAYEALVAKLAPKLGAATDEVAAADAVATEVEVVTSE